MKDMHTIELGCLTKWVEFEGRWTKVHSDMCTEQWLKFELTAAVLELEIREAGGLPLGQCIQILREFGVPVLHKSLLEVMGWLLLCYTDDDDTFASFREDFSRAILPVTESEYLAHKAIGNLPRDEAVELFAAGPLARFFEKKRRDAWVRRQTVDTGCLALDYILPRIHDEYYEAMEVSNEASVGHSWGATVEGSPPV